MDNKFELILCIVNSGFADQVMSFARECGAKGGTIINARGTAREEAEKLIHMAIHPEKEIVMILAEEKIKDDILHTIYKNVGLDTPGQGIAFTLPVDETAFHKKKPVNVETTEENN